MVSFPKGNFQSTFAFFTYTSFGDADELFEVIEESLDEDIIASEGKSIELESDYDIRPLIPGTFDVMMDFCEKQMGIRPTNEQLDTILHANTPLFINGQAGTGKTVMLSLRAALRHLRAIQESLSIDVENGDQIDLRDLTGHDLDWYRVEIVNVENAENWVGVSLANNFGHDCYIREDVEGNAYNYGAADNTVLLTTTPNLTVGMDHGSQGGTISILVIADFPDDDTETGLQGDMNDDGSLNIYDVLALVNEILSGDWF